MPDGQPISPASSSGMSMVACRSEATLAMTLKDGILLNSQGRTGYIAANYQFQFDKLTQIGAVYTAGWSVCSNGSLALGGSTTFYQCLSGNFYNLYNENWVSWFASVTLLDNVLIIRRHHNAVLSPSMPWAWFPVRHGLLREYT